VKEENTVLSLELVLPAARDGRTIAGEQCSQAMIVDGVEVFSDALISTQSCLPSIA
jgi:hypothetical protein